MLLGFSSSFSYLWWIVCCFFVILYFNSLLVRLGFSVEILGGQGYRRDPQEQLYIFFDQVPKGITSQGPIFVCQQKSPI